MIEVFFKGLNQVDLSGEQLLPELFYRLKATNQPVLFALSGEDITAQEFLAVTELEPWREWLQDDSIQLAQFQGADHTFSRQSSMAELAELCQNWLANLKARCVGRFTSYSPSDWRAPPIDPGLFLNLANTAMQR